MFRWKILLIIGSLNGIKGFDFRIHYCRFQCSNSCQEPVETSNPNGEAKAPAAYYWRDFHGVVPPDAYQLGASGQFPQTYIGLVYDFEKKGYFATTIYDGLDYVYTVLEGGNSTKLSEHIQILCTESPEDLAWFQLTPETYKNQTAAGYKVVHAGFYASKTSMATNHWVVKTVQCHITYASAITGFTTKMEYAAIDGSYQSTDEFLWLMYLPKNGNKPQEEEKKTAPSSGSSRSFISHHYEYRIQPDSIIPKFYKKLTIGSCSVTCTNEDKDAVSKMKNNVKLSASMAYFWQQKGLIEEGLSVPSGLDYSGRTSYIGQTQISTLNFVDVGQSDLKDATVNYGTANLAGNTYYHVMGSNYQDDLKWVNTTSDEFSSLDKDTLIPGGGFSNGTNTFVCRTVDDRYGTLYPGSARELSDGTPCYSFFGPEDSFQVLAYQKKEE